MAEHKFPGKSKGQMAVSISHGEALILQGLANPRAFKTGSEGYNVVGKATGTDGNEYQVSVNVTRIGSQDEPEAAERAKVATLIAKEKEAERARRTKGRNK